MKSGGVVFFHDASNESCPGCIKAIEELGAAVIPIGRAGLGVLVKP